MGVSLWETTALVRVLNTLVRAIWTSQTEVLPGTDGVTPRNDLAFRSQSLHRGAIYFSSSKVRALRPAEQRCPFPSFMGS